MSEAEGVEGRSRLRTGDYRHPAELPTLVAALWLAVTTVLAAEVAMVLMVTVLAGPTRGVSLYVGIALLLWFNGGLVWALWRMRNSLRALGTAAVEPAADVFKAVREVAVTLGMSFVPAVRVLPDGGLEALALGFRRPELYLGERLLGELLHPLELRAIIARELGHLACGHAGLRTLFGLPAPEHPMHWALELPRALGRGCMRWWWSLAERSADRAAAIVVGGPEPLGHALSRLAVARAQRPLTAEDELRRYCDDLFAGHPARLPRLIYQYRLLDAARLDALARFANSQRFGSCLALVGHLSHQAPEPPPDPERAPLAPYAVNWLLALVYLSVPVALWARGGNAPPAAARSPAPEPALAAQPFDPEADAAVSGGAEGSGALTAAGGSDVQSGLLELARMHKARGDYHKARRALEDLIRVNPLHAQAHFMLAWVCVELGDRRAALAEFTATTNLTDPHSSLHIEAQAALQRMVE